MKITTLNLKNTDYCENHEIFVGTQTGSFKKLSVASDKPHSQDNLQSLSSLQKESSVTALDFADSDQTEILIGRSNKILQIYSTDSNNFIEEIDLVHGPIVGLARFDEKIIAGFATGKIEKLGQPEPLTIMSGDHMSRMRQCPMDKKLIASGGKDRQNNLKIFDLAAEGKEIFKTKNLPNDSLQLEVPIWDSDFRFIDSNIVATCSRYGYVRLYDIRKQRRPILKFATDDNQMTFCSMATEGNLIYTGTTMGVIKGFDTRKFKNFVHTYKGFTGSVSDLNLDSSGKYLCSASLDRYVRIHQTETCKLLYQCYVKSKATRVIIRNGLGKITEIESELQANEERTRSGVEEAEVKADSDPEYEQLFENMETVCENETNEKTVKRKNSRNTKIDKNKKKKII